MLGVPAAVGQQVGVVLIEELDLAGLDHRVLLAQGHQLLVVAVDGVGVAHLGGGVDGLVVVHHADPGFAGGKARVGRSVPLHGGAAVVPAALLDDLQRLGGGLALLLEDLVVVQALHIPELADGGKVAVGHAQLLALVDVRGAPHHVGGGAQHFGALFPVPALVAKAADGAGLVVVAPEQGVPAVAGLHPLLPEGEQVFQGHVVGGHQGPLVPVLVVHLQVVEAEGHGQLVVVGVGVADAVLQAGGGHLAHRDHPLDAAGGHQLLQVAVDVPAVGVEAAAVALVVVLEHFGLGDQVDHVEAEALDALALPEAEDRGQLGPDLGVLPVQVGLADVEQVQVPLAQAGHILPGRAAEFGHPVGGQLVGAALLEDVVVLILLLPGQSPLEPRVVGGGVVEHHVQHQADAALVRLPDEGLQVLHRAETGVDGAVVGHVVAVVMLRRGEEGGQPEVIHPQVLEIVQLGGHAGQVAQAVAVGVAKRFGVDLVDDFILKICHESHLPFL